MDHTGKSRKVVSLGRECVWLYQLMSALTLGCIAYSRLPCRLSLLQPLSRVPGTQSRRTSSLDGPRPLSHLQLIFQKGKYTGCGVLRGCIEPFEMVGWFIFSCCSGWRLGLPLFPVSPIYTLQISLMKSSNPYEMIGSWPHIATVLRWLWCWFALFPVSPIYTLFISLMMPSYFSFYDGVLYILLLHWCALKIFSSLKR